MAKTYLELRKGDAATLTETISGLSSLAGYSAKLYIYKKNGTSAYSVSGVISSLTITYTFLNEVTRLYDVGTYNYETKIWDALDNVYTPSYGTFVILSALNTNPS